MPVGTHQPPRPVQPFQWRERRAGTGDLERSRGEGLVPPPHHLHTQARNRPSGGRQESDALGTRLDEGYSAIRTQYGKWNSGEAAPGANVNHPRSARRQPGHGESVRQVLRHELVGIGRTGQIDVTIPLQQQREVGSDRVNLIGAHGNRPVLAQPRNGCPSVVDHAEQYRAAAPPHSIRPCSA